MGAGYSGLAAGGDGKNINGGGACLRDIPEGCVALVLSHLDPEQVCRLACLNRTFRQASLADTVWEPKLPENHQILAKKLFSEYCSFSSLPKKDIYARLRSPTRFAGGTKEVWMERGGGICVSISWKGMKITGIDDRRYWNHISTVESRFGTIAYLQQIWWVEAEGNLEFEFPAGTYSLYFRLQLGRPSRTLGRRVCNLERVHGWNIKPVRFQLSSSSSGSHDQEQQASTAITSQRYLSEVGKWIHYHVGDFSVFNSDVPTKLKFSLTQIDCTHTKGGLCLDSVFICPSHLRDKGLEKL